MRLEVVNLPVTNPAVSKMPWPRCTMWSSNGITMSAGSVTMPPNWLE